MLSERWRFEILMWNMGAWRLHFKKYKLKGHVVKFSKWAFVLKYSVGTFFFTIFFFEFVFIKNVDFQERNQFFFHYFTPKVFTQFQENSIVWKFGDGFQSHAINSFHSFYVISFFTSGKTSFEESQLWRQYLWDNRMNI